MAAQPARVTAAVEPLAVLDCDPAERSERRGLLQHPLGEVRVQAHTFPFAGAEWAGLSQIEFDTPSRPKSWTKPARYKVRS